MKNSSHAIGCSQLVLWHYECHQRPEGTRQHRVGHAHQDHGYESDEGLIGKEGEHGVSAKGGHCAKVHCQWEIKENVNLLLRYTVEFVRKMINDCKFSLLPMATKDTSDLQYW